MFRRLFILGVVAMAPFAAMPPATAAADPSAACKGGGYVNFKDPTTGRAFANQGRCVSTLARGGALVPVVAPVNIYIREAVGVPGSGYTGPNGVSVSITGQPGTYPVTVTIDEDTIFAGDFTIGGEGLAQQVFVVAPGSHEVVVTVEDQTLTQTVVVPEPEPEVSSPSVDVQLLGRIAVTGWELQFTAAGLDPTKEYYYAAPMVNGQVSTYTGGRPAADGTLPPFTLRYICGEGYQSTVPETIEVREQGTRTVVASVADFNACPAPVPDGVLDVDPVFSPDDWYAVYTITGLPVGEQLTVLIEGANGRVFDIYTLDVQSNGMARNAFGTVNGAVTREELCAGAPWTFTVTRADGTVIEGNRTYDPPQC